MKKITKIDIGSAAKAGGIFAMLSGLLIGASFIIWALASGGAGALPLGTGVVVVTGLLFIPGILGFYGIVGGALFAWLFNATSRMTGGLAIELE